MEDEFILFPPKMSQVFGFTLQKVALFVTLHCVDVGERVCEDMKERKRDTLMERSGKREYVSMDGASGVLLRIEI